MGIFNSLHKYNVKRILIQEGKGSANCENMLTGMLIRFNLNKHVTGYNVEC